MNTNNFYNPYRNRPKTVGLFFCAMLLLTILSAFWSCDDFSDTTLPVSELNAGAVFEEKGTANAAMTDIYAKIRENGLLTGKTNGISKEMGLYADELVWYGSNALASIHFYNNTLQPNNSNVSGWWNNAYSQIYAANAVIEGVTASTKLEQSEGEHLKGEALFVRSLLHFYLMQLYGEVPFIATTDYKQNTRVKRMPASEMTTQLINDLNTAAELLPDAYKTETRTRPNSYTVKALLARVYLYSGMWAEAANSASAVLNNTETYVWQTDLNAVFLKGSTTTIWQLMPRTASRNTDEGGTFIFNAGPPPTTALAPGLFAAFESGDQRRIKWVRTISNASGTWYHAYKYKKSSTSNPPTEYPIVFRLAEQYLIRAEARAMQGELIGAKEDLNKVRNTAGLGDSEAVTQIEIITAIANERRVELFTEYGHRFFDLKRAGKLDAVLLGTKPGWNSTDRLIPVSEQELGLNPNLLPQNPGY